MKRKQVVKNLLLTAFCVWTFLNLQLTAFAAPEQLCVGGMLFGVELDLDGVLVTDFAPFSSGGVSCSPAKDAGLLPGDLIESANGREVEDLEDFVREVSASEGEEVTLVLLRDSTRQKLRLTPQKSDEDGAFRAGFWARESMAGIGTVTYIDPEKHTFGGLGHGVCEAEQEQLLPLEGGTAYSAVLRSIVRGKTGAPGRLSASFSNQKFGTVTKNTLSGVFGEWKPNDLGKPLPLADGSDVSVGNASLRCSVDQGPPQDYGIEICEIISADSPTKNFIVKITDARLLEKTGGIVQGMSGSPILQNGKLVGALTHVLVKDPTRGYGIFIENMLASADRPMKEAS